MSSFANYFSIQKECFRSQLLFRYKYFFEPAAPMQNNVILRVYDLSNGQAKLISKRLLGIQLDGIWHTSIEVFGNEYFFSKQITSCIPGMTRYGTPVHVHDLGVSKKTVLELEKKLIELEKKFNAQTYNVLLNNCNHFSDDVAFFLLEKNLPRYIMQIHENVLETPLAAAFIQMGNQFNPGAE